MGIRWVLINRTNRIEKKTIVFWIQTIFHLDPLKNFARRILVVVHPYANFVSDFSPFDLERYKNIKTQEIVTCIVVWFYLTRDGKRQ